MFGTSKYTSSFTPSWPKVLYFTHEKRYSFSFNGQERDDEVAGVGNIMTATFWEYDARLGRRWNIDPKSYSWESSYSTMGNNPICMNDRNGDKWKDPAKDSKKASELKANLKKREKELGKEAERYERKAKRFDGKNQEKFEKYSNLAKIAKEGFKQMNDAQRELEVMGDENTSQVFTFTLFNGVGVAKIKMDEKGVINIPYENEDNILAIHESFHGFQHLKGDLRIEQGGTDFLDIHDEVNAYKRQFFYEPSSVTTIKLYNKEYVDETIRSFDRITPGNIRRIMEFENGRMILHYFDFSEKHLPTKE
jgi:hypothetical protein